MVYHCLATLAESSLAFAVRRMGQRVVVHNLKDQKDR